MTDRSVFVKTCRKNQLTLCFRMPKISAAAAERRRDRILDAARDCFAEHGIHVSVDEICSRAGISKGAFYGYFSSKDAAIQALAETHEEIIHKFAGVQSLAALSQELAELTTKRSTASSRLELETWVYALKQPALRNLLWKNIDELKRSLKSGIKLIRSGSRAQKHTVSTEAAAEILSIFAMGLIARSALKTKSRSNSGEDSLTKLIEALLADKN